MRVRQSEIVDAMINRRVAGIVLAPVDRPALVAVMERAGQKGIPVAIFDFGHRHGQDFLLCRH
jgi:ABC-type sugar transport system substrate-binding protein